eukprot:TRINITY_DN79377_c0_g1_i1.p1 TRINITY_DN79377_c0_g1~~TRINITY_DN79377_c0_g1_i1.p1  ORF type:complete len:552 (+),score=97.52 TRINITY_DN79377_c0_g1_i1:92-1747(+)
MTGREGRDQGALFHTIEQLAALETTLYFILEGVKSKAADVSFLCREYWGTSASLAQLSLDELEWNDQLKLHVRQACVLESLSLAVVSRFSSGTMQDISTAIRLKLRNLMYHLHESCLVLLDLVRQRWIEDRAPGRPGAEKMKRHCPHNLDFSILSEAARYTPLRRGEHAMKLREHNDIIPSLLQPLCKGTASESSGDSGILAAVRDLLLENSSQNPMRAKTVRASMLQRLRFQPLSDDKSTDDSSKPVQDLFERLGKHRFGTDGEVIRFKPLPPMVPDLETNPVLPPPKRTGGPGTYTLVLDLDETLVHSSATSDGSKGTYGVRPGVPEFLKKMSGLGFELVIFTTATQEYADRIIDEIDPERFIQHRLYRQHTILWGPICIKDLSRIGRHLDRTVIIDNMPDTFAMQPQNGIHIADWFDDPNDQALYDLSPLLEELIVSRMRVWDILEKYHNQIPMWAGLEHSPVHSGNGPCMSQPGMAVCQPMAAPTMVAAQFVPMVMPMQAQWNPVGTMAVPASFKQNGDAAQNVQLQPMVGQVQMVQVMYPAARMAS